MKTKRPPLVVGGYAPDGPAICTAVYVGFTELEDGREHVACLDGAPLIAAGAAGLEWLYQRAQTVAVLSGRPTIVRQYAGGDIVRTVAP